MPGTIQLNDSSTLRYVLDLATRESVVLAEVDGTDGTVQIEYGFVSRANHVDVGGPMIIRVNDKREVRRI